MKIKQLVGAGISLVASVLLAVNWTDGHWTNSSKALATPLGNQRAFARQRVRFQTAGANIRLVNGWQDLDCSCSYTLLRDSINKEMWVIYSGNAYGYEWIEAGQKRGLQIIDLNQPSDYPEQDHLRWTFYWI